VPGNEKSKQKTELLVAVLTPRFLMFLVVILNHFLMISHNPSFCPNKTKVFEGTASMQNIIEIPCKKQGFRNMRPS